jgi:hypothetical protein
MWACRIKSERQQLCDCRSGSLIQDRSSLLKRGVQVLEFVFKRFPVPLPGRLCNGELCFKFCNYYVSGTNIRDLRFRVVVQRINGIVFAIDGNGLSGCFFGR